jgi:DNA mismatch endonuclease, patch repair protein
MNHDTWRKPPKKPYKPRDPSLTSSMMSQVKGKNNKAEIALRKELWKRGYRYRLYDPRLPGKPDLVFSGCKVVVFIDGDFWHGRALIEQGEEALLQAIRTERNKWWLEKLSKTVERDKKVTQELKDNDWKVIRLWESQVKADVKIAADRVEELLKEVRSIDQNKKEEGHSTRTSLE